MTKIDGCAFPELAQIKFRKNPVFTLVIGVDVRLVCPAKTNQELLVSINKSDESWELKAACRGPHTDLFFPPDHFEKKTEREFRERQAKSICSGCAVSDDCLQYALRIREPHGVWGGLNESERKLILEREFAAS